MDEYTQFLNSKAQDGLYHGFDVDEDKLNGMLFPFQKDLVKWALKKGKAAIFADCGLGKTAMQLEWAQKIVERTNKSVLVITPLSVSSQTVEEGEKFGIECVRSGDGKVKAGSRITVTNYERLHHFDSEQFAGVVCDESSIIKNFEGTTKSVVTEFMRTRPYRLLCTATASPNDYIELGTSAEAIGEMGRMDMLSMFFKNDENSLHPIWWGARWRFKAHAEKPFWKWVVSWARAIRKPSDMGFSDDGFVLPELIEREHVVKADTPRDGMLFDMAAVRLDEQREERRLTLGKRCAKVADLVNGKRNAVCWCHLNSEADLLEKLIPESIQVSGNDSDEAKESKFAAFKAGEIRVLITKPKIGAFGLNWQHCNHEVFFPSHSFEQYYQGVRRCWRFGQTKPVTIDIVTSEGEIGVMKNLQRKAAAADKMFSMLVTDMMNEMKLSRKHMNANKDQVTIDKCQLINGDCVEAMKELPEDSVGLSIYSPPFGGLYQYSSAEEDLSNSLNYGQFFKHFDFCVKEIARVTMPGRMTCVHCMDVPRSGVRDGSEGLIDFPGDIIRQHEKMGFKYWARFAIWKEPLRTAIRTRSKGLKHAQIVKDASFVNNAGADFVLVFKKDGINKEPIQNPEGLQKYCGEREIPRDLDEKYKNWKDDKTNKRAHWIWQQYASAFWDDIRQNHVLPYREARESEEEKHCHPLQLDVIERLVLLWSNPNDVVLTPFMGVGSEVFGALSNGRRAIGIELKESYYRQACKNVKLVGCEKEQETMCFDRESEIEEAIKRETLTEAIQIKKKSQSVRPEVSSQSAAIRAIEEMTR